uniref:Uncharacterized protein n=1 Tax=Spongospora subterranea TaxID=70186 RepID=A0A0H5QZ57_9EUKA|eukprot:CRZ07214.1 hypothetical protein [Spongospora subterranea]
MWESELFAVNSETLVDRQCNQVQIFGRYCGCRDSDNIRGNHRGKGVTRSNNPSRDQVHWIEEELIVRCRWALALEGLISAIMWREVHFIKGLCSTYDEYPK